MYFVLGPGNLQAKEILQITNVLQLKVILQQALYIINERWITNSAMKLGPVPLVNRE